ncbi:MAG: FtsW/RodA/SpoVE family cell cycle protein [Thermotogota bacterium]
MKKSHFKLKPLLIFAIFLALSLMGYFNLESAVINSRFTRLPHLQINWIVIAVILSIITVLYFEKAKITKLLIPGYVVSLSLLLLLLLFGESWGGSRRWFSTPIGGFQPSEFVKPFIIIFYSYLYSHGVDSARVSFVNFILTLPIAILIILEPDFGTGMVFVFTFLVYYSMAEKKKKRLFLFFTMMIILFLMIYSFGLKPYQKERITAFLDPSHNPDTYYHTQQSVTMVASGGIYGKGYQRGLGNLYGYIPADHTDFVLAVYAEEEGFLGMLVFFALWFSLFSINISLIREKNGIKKWLSLGVFSIFFIQFTINVGMVLGLLPVTGLPLPFFTYGGSSTVSNAIMIGILLWSAMSDDKRLEVLSSRLH